MSAAVVGSDKARTKSCWVAITRPAYEVRFRAFSGRNQREADIQFLMSGFRGKADVPQRGYFRLLVARSGHVPQRQVLLS